YQIIIRTQLKSLHPVPDAVAGSKKKNRRPNCIAPQFGHDLPTVFVWQHDIDDEKIEPSAPRARQTGFAILRKIDNETGFAESFRKKRCCFLFVFDHENAHCSSV